MSPRRLASASRNRRRVITRVAAGARPPPPALPAPSVASRLLHQFPVEVRRPRMVLGPRAPVVPLVHVPADVLLEVVDPVETGPLGVDLAEGTAPTRG